MVLVKRISQYFDNGNYGKWQILHKRFKIRIVRMFSNILVFVWWIFPEIFWNLCIHFLLTGGPNCVTWWTEFVPNITN